jgi:hypothetical protein
MQTPEQKASTSRANGAKSRGPITPAGKAKSARNALRHGLSARRVTLPEESEPAFRAFLQSYLDRFEPRDPVELELVHSMAVTRWRLRRCTLIDTNMFSNTLARSRDEADSYLDNMDDDERLAWTFKVMSDRTQCINLLVRYEGMLTRAYDRALRQLQEIRRAAKTPTPERTQLSDPPA